MSEEPEPQWLKLHKSYTVLGLAHGHRFVNGATVELTLEGYGKIRVLLSDVRHYQPANVFMISGIVPATNQVVRGVYRAARADAAPRGHLRDNSYRH